tara:strand:+ start:10493 stop:12745 length:2253 start_codon:yes stop_codon:yes gene_type:complete
MKKQYLLIITLILSINVFSQNPGDTIVVQTFDYSMTYGQAWGPPRDTIAYFPSDTNLTFERIIMAYSMRCKDAQVNTSGGNNVACGEWDYSCNTYIHDSTRVDSILFKTNNYSILGFNGLNYSYTTIPVYNYFWVIDSIGNYFLDSTLNDSDTIIEFGIISNFGTLNNDIIDTLSVNYYWQPFSYTYDSSGSIIDIDTLQIDGTISIGQLSYYKRYPMAFQIMSFVTPYGIGLDLGVEGKTWYFDLTDYAPIFKGPKRITMDAGGQWQEDMDIKFLFIVGTPPRDVLETQNIWKVQSKSYTSIQSNNVFEPRNHKLYPNAGQYIIKTAITGHGQQGEFIPQTHKMEINGAILDSWRVWKECSENPIYPQGGTWIYDRAGWCPGMATDIREFDITPYVTQGQNNIFDYGINGGSGTSNYWVSSCLVSYGQPNFNIDARILNILSPTNNVSLSRKNPICSKPKIIIQNSGSTTLTSLKIEYWINNNTQKEMYDWTGSLDFLESDTVILPDPSALWSNLIENADNEFFAEISLPNGTNDSYLFNNLSKTKFRPAPILPPIFTIWTKTNSGVVSSWTNESETSWEIFNNDGLLEYASPIFYSNTQYRDTVEFSPGCYTLKVTDTDDDGLDFWANNDGIGYLKLREIGASWLHTFEPDFGRSINYEFRVDEILSINQENIDYEVFPNPSRNTIIVNSTLKNIDNINIRDNLGRIIINIPIDGPLSYVQVDVSNLSKGVYYISIGEEGRIKKFVKQ